MISKQARAAADAKLSMRGGPVSRSSNAGIREVEMENEFLKTMRSPYSRKDPGKQQVRVNREMRLGHGGVRVQSESCLCIGFEFTSPATYNCAAAGIATAQRLEGAETAHQEGITRTLTAPTDTANTTPSGRWGHTRAGAGAPTQARAGPALPAQPKRVNLTNPIADRTGPRGAATSPRRTGEKSLPTSFHSTRGRRRIWRRIDAARGKKGSHGYRWTNTPDPADIPSIRNAARKGNAPGSHIHADRGK